VIYSQHCLPVSAKYEEKGVLGFKAIDLAMALLWKKNGRTSLVHIRTDIEDRFLRQQPYSSTFILTGVARIGDLMLGGAADLNESAETIIEDVRIVRIA
jgi:hypothetical protein